MSTKDLSYCHVAERTDVGCKRQANEDNLIHFECENGLVATVCDGMGGHVGGAVASQTAIDAIRNFLTCNYIDDPRTAIVMAIDTANNAILEKARLEPELTGMGATCVLLLVRDGRVYIGSVGDSRVYLIRSRQIRQLTKDQSFVQMLVDCGEISKEEAENHPRKNEITNCLGIENMQIATVLEDDIIPLAGDCFLLCSDGLTGMVSDDVIGNVVSRQAELTTQQRVDTLVELARQNGGLDNITVQIVEFAENPATIKNNERRRKLKFYSFIGGCIAVFILFVVAVTLLIKHIAATPNGEDAKIENVRSEDSIKSDSTLMTISEVELNKGVCINIKSSSPSHITITYNDSVTKNITLDAFVEQKIDISPNPIEIKTKIESDSIMSMTFKTDSLNLDTFRLTLNDVISTPHSYSITLQPKAK